MTIGFGYLTYPSFNIAWDEHTLPAILHRLLEATGPEHRRLVWWAAALAQQNGYEVSTDNNFIEIKLPNGLVGLHADSDFMDAEYGGGGSIIDAFCAEQLKDLPKPPEDAMRYGESPYVLERLVDHPFETLKDRLSFRGEEV